MVESRLRVFLYKYTGNQWRNFMLGAAKIRVGSGVSYPENFWNCLNSQEMGLFGLHSLKAVRVPAD